jgi:hypothetical protein
MNVEDHAKDYENDLVVKRFFSSSPKRSQRTCPSCNVLDYLFYKSGNILHGKLFVFIWFDANVMKF